MPDNEKEAKNPSRRAKERAKPLLMKELSRAGRALADLSQQELADLASVSESTVRDFEKGRRVPSYNNLMAIQRALESCDVMFLIEEPGLGGPGVRLARRLEDKIVQHKEAVTSVLELVEQSKEPKTTGTEQIAEAVSEDAAKLEGKKDTIPDLDPTETDTTTQGDGVEPKDEEKREITSDSEGNPFALMHDLLQGLQKQRDRFK